MSSGRVTERSISSRVINNLQGNIRQIAEVQRQLSSGKLISRASDNPGGAVSAMQLRGDVARQKQHSRNCDDGLGWLGLADLTLGTVNEQVNRVRDLTLQGMNTGSLNSQARHALAQEVDNVRKSILGLANVRYIDRPIFGGTTSGLIAFDDTGTYVGDSGSVVRTIGDNARVRVDADALSTFGSGATQLFTVLSDISDGLRNDPDSLGGLLGKLDTSATAVRSAQSRVGACYNQLTKARQTAEDRVISLTTQLSDVEDIDLPKTITDLSLRQTAYEAALAATAKVVQPSLVDFLR